jgi:hypothetical protein
MGEAAENLYEGLVCSWCGVYFEACHGFPVLCPMCYRSSTKKERDGLQKAIEKEL